MMSTMCSVFANGFLPKQPRVIDWHLPHTVFRTIGSRNGALKHCPNILLATAVNSLRMNSKQLTPTPTGIFEIFFATVAFLCPRVQMFSLPMLYTVLSSKSFRGLKMILGSLLCKPLNLYLLRNTGATVGVQQVILWV